MGELQLMFPKRGGVARREASMWREKHEYSLDELLDHPVLGLAMTRIGIDRRAVELLLETAPPAREREFEAPDDLVAA
ncbi:MAG TPA: hypothetical protein VNV18_02680 [Stellaceae bacterium]|nr:hypothetical protein [Stellaceae bacterium]